MTPNDSPATELPFKLTQEKTEVRKGGKRRMGGGGTFFFCQGPYGYLQHHSRAVQNNQVKNEPATDGWTEFRVLPVSALAGPSQVIPRALCSLQAGHPLPHLERQV